MRVRLKDVRHGSGPVRRNIVYGVLVNADDDVMIVCSTLAHILSVVEDRGYVLVGEDL